MSSYNEATICTILKNSIINQGGLCWKIPDPSSSFSQTIERPFDMFGVYRQLPLYCEVKYMPKLESFNLQRIEDHQITNLLAIQRSIPTTYTWVVLGVHAARGDMRLYLFDDMEDLSDRREQKNNYKKKELEGIPFYSVKKGLITLTN